MFFFTPPISLADSPTCHKNIGYASKFLGTMSMTADRKGFILEQLRGLVPLGMVSSRFPVPREFVMTISFLIL